MMAVFDQYYLRQNPSILIDDTAIYPLFTPPVSAAIGDGWFFYVLLLLHRSNLCHSLSLKPLSYGKL